MGTSTLHADFRTCLLRFHCLEHTIHVRPVCTYTICICIHIVYVHNTYTYKSLQRITLRWSQLIVKQPPLSSNSGLSSVSGLTSPHGVAQDPAKRVHSIVPRQPRPRLLRTHQWPRAGLLQERVRHDVIVGDDANSPALLLP